jgi:hypothetical protein
VRIGGGRRGEGTLIHCWGECKLVQSLWKTVWRLLKKLKIELPYDLTSSKVMLVRLRRPKATCFLSYVIDRPNTNTATL